MFVQEEYRSFLPIFGPHFAIGKPLQSPSFSNSNFAISIAEKVVILTI